MREEYLEAVIKARDRLDVGKEDVTLLIAPESVEEEVFLLKQAHSKRLETLGPGVHLRGIIEFSNYCRQDCLYCGLRKSNKALARYRMSPQEILETAQEAMKLHKFGTFVLQSGEDSGYDPRTLAQVIRSVKSLGAAVTLSVGQWSREHYALWKEAGADRFLLKHETGDPLLFQLMKPTTDLASRLQCLADLRDLGYQVGSGIILGLPGQTLSAVAGDLLLMKDYDFEMVSIGPFIPHPDTPLGLSGSAMSQDLPALIRRTLVVTAGARLMVPSAHIPGTTALGVLTGGGQCRSALYREYAGLLGMPYVSQDHLDARSLALYAGANVIMPDVTPGKYRESYSIYPGKPGADGGEVSLAVRGALKRISSLGTFVCPGRGDSPKPPWEGNRVGNEQR